MNGEVATELSQGEMDFCMRREFGELSERLFLTSLQCLMMLAALRGLDSPFRETQVYLAKTGGPLLCARPLPGPTWHPAWHIPSKICPEKNLQQPCVLFHHRIEEVKGFRAIRLEKMEKYEKENCGGFRLIYPTLNSEKYDKFFQDNNSLFQNTVTSRAREVYAR